MAHVTSNTLIIEDDQNLAKMLRSYIVKHWPGAKCEVANSILAARELFSFGPTLVLLDVSLPDGLGSSLLPELLRMMPAPVVIAMSGTATAKDAFELASNGARAFLAKPLSFEELSDAIEGAQLSPLAQMDAARSLVGVASIHDVQKSVRKAMLIHALHVTGENRTATARLLSVTRQAVQQMIRELEVKLAPRGRNYEQ